jgi:hypothetical protein
MNDSELGNKLVEREHLDLFLWSYEMNASPAKSSPTSWTTRRPISSPAMKQAMWSGLRRLKFHPNTMFWHRTFDRAKPRRECAALASCA